MLTHHIQVKCALEDWKEGTRADPSDNPFEETVYESFYRKQLRNLEKWEKHSPDHFELFQKQTYERVWYEPYNCDAESY